MNVQERYQIVREYFISRCAGKVRRFHTTGSLLQENVAEHCRGVALLCDIICAGNPSANLLRVALRHDDAELVTGDIPADFKWSNPDVFGAVERAELYFEDNTGVYYPRMNSLLTPEEYGVLRVADALDGMAFCVDEVVRGSHVLDRVLFRYSVYCQAKLELNDVAQQILYNLLHTVSLVRNSKDLEANFLGGYIPDVRG